MRGTQRRSIFRRRKAGLTDYRRRLKLLRGRKVTVTGSDLTKKYGWPEDFSQKSVPASYLVGFAMGKAAMAHGYEEAVLDVGLAATPVGGRVFAALKGMVDAGLEVPHGEQVLPEEDRINGAHIGDNIAGAVESTKKSIEEAY